MLTLGVRLHATLTRSENTPEVSSREKESWEKAALHSDDALMLNLECDHPEKGFLPAEGQGTLCFLTQPMRERLCPSDPSRGFLFAAMFHDEDTELFGFDDGLKHYWDPANTPAMFHEMEVEHEVLRDLGWVGP